MNNTALKEWLKLTEQNKRNIFAETARQKALPIVSVEKDWWVVHTLELIFSMDYANALRNLTTMVSELFNDRPFANKSIIIPTVNPERTLLEKIFLLHEEFHLYNTIVAHRNKFSHLSGVDYAKHNPQNIRIVPPVNLLSLWEKDYESMTKSMIYGERLNFNDLIGKISELQKKINVMEWPR